MGTIRPGQSTCMDQAKGRIIAFDQPNSTSGYLVPDAELSAKFGNLKAYFKDVPFSGGHEQTIVGVSNGTFDAGVSLSDGVGDWADGYSSGVFRKATDAGLVDMHNLVEIWRLALIPEGPMVVRSALPQDVKGKVAALTAALTTTDMTCAQGVAGGEVKGFVPVDLSVYDGILAARKLQEKNG